MSFRAAWSILFPLEKPVACSRLRLSKWYCPAQTRLSAPAIWFEGTAVRKPRPPMLIPRIGVREPAISRATRSIVPSPPKTSSRSTLRQSVAASGSTQTSSFAIAAVAASAHSSRPAARMSRAALEITEAPEVFSEFPNSPTFAILSASFFNQCQEFFVAGRPKERRFGYTCPPQPVLAGDKSLQFRQHARVDAGILNHPAAAVRFLFACLELWFYQRDDFSRGLQQ